MIKTARGLAFLCPWCGCEIPIAPGSEPAPLQYSGCPRCAGAVQVPLRFAHAPWLEQVADETKLPLSVANRIHELRSQLRHKGVIH